MKRYLFIFIILSFVCILYGETEKRLALVIGNSSYKDNQLQHAITDVDSMCKALWDVGFQVTSEKNGTYDSMFTQVKNFSSKLKEAGHNTIAIFYYIGYGVQFTEKNYLLPVDKTIKEIDEVEYNAVDLDFIIEKVTFTQCKTNIFIIDASYDNPSMSLKKDIKQKGLAQVNNPPVGVMIVFSAMPGELTERGKMKNGLFTETFIRYMKLAGIEIEIMVREVKDEIVKKTDGKQNPWYNSNLSKEGFQFINRKPNFVQESEKASVEIESLLLKKNEFKNMTARALFDLIIEAFHEKDYKKALEYIRSIKEAIYNANEKDIINKLEEYAIRENISEETKTKLILADQLFENKEYESAYEIYKSLIYTLNTYYKGKATEKINQCIEQLFFIYFERAKELYSLKQWEECLKAIDKANSYKRGDAYLDTIRKEVVKKLDDIKKKSMLALLDEFEKCIKEKNYKRAREIRKEIKTELLDYKERDRYNKLLEKLKMTGIQDILVLVEGGSFMRGSNSGDEDEKPLKRVKIDSFYMCKFEVSQRIWEFVMGDNPSQFKESSLPAERVSWLDAINFCNNASIIDGLNAVYEIHDNTVTCNFKANGYRLPTEGEWEYAARGGKYHESYLYSGSDDETGVAWYRTEGISQTQPFGRKSPNSLHLYDMSGNVWEWCWDWYSKDYYNDPKSLENPQGPEKGSDRVIRGGSWFVNPEFCRVCNRSNREPGKMLSSDGFRVVRSYIQDAEK